MTANNTKPNLSINFSTRTKKLDDILAQLENLWPDSGDRLQRWRQTLNTINKLRLNFSLPVTCIGPVKSGKSTLINALAGADLLPTGAGITTNFPTTLSAGEKFSAKITLQPSIVINELFSKAAHLLFSDELQNSSLSLFETDDQLQVRELIKNHQVHGNLTQHGIFNESYRLLKNLTAGADKVSKYYDNQELNFTINDPEEPAYRHFIRDETRSPFLSEIHIKAPLKLLPPHLSLRDLPGLDTPNPSHQSIIIQQLSESPALIYVVNSRIGLRQADYQLLEHLHQLGLQERLLFVINLDLDVHLDADELKIMVQRCTDELNELGFTQPKYAFSALALFWTQKEIFDQLNLTCKRRLQTWQEEQKKLKIADAGAKKFLDRLSELGRNEATNTLLQHSEKRLLQVANNTKLLINNELYQLEQKGDSFRYDLNRQADDRNKIDAVLNETERIITGICNDVEKFGHNEIIKWLDDKKELSFRTQLEQIIANYQAPLELLPEKNRNPLTPVRFIDNHFQLTVPVKIQEKTTIETIKFLNNLHLELNERLLKGCAPLFILCENFVKHGEIQQNELPLPVKIGGNIPLFTLSSEAEERFAMIDKIYDMAQLLGRKIIRFRRQLTLGQEYSQQIKTAAHRELPRWLKNYREQLKYALIRPHINECNELVSTFFTDLLASSQTILQGSSQLTDLSREATTKRTRELEALLLRLQE
ncbi:dynamin family protein [bacterium]|nr:dynamin family protein [bacterium]